MNVSNDVNEARDMIKSETKEATKIKIAKKLLLMGSSIEFIHKITTLEIEKIKCLIAQDEIEEATKIEIAKRLLKEGSPVEFIYEATLLEIEQIQSIETEMVVNLRKYLAKKLLIMGSSVESVQEITLLEIEIIQGILNELAEINISEIPEDSPLVKRAFEILKEGKLILPKKLHYSKAEIEAMWKQICSETYELTKRQKRDGHI